MVDDFINPASTGSPDHLSPADEGADPARDLRRHVYQEQVMQIARALAGYSSDRRPPPPRHGQKKGRSWRRRRRLDGRQGHQRRS